MGNLFYDASPASGISGNSVAFRKSTSQRIYPKQCGDRIGKKRHECGLKHALRTLDGNFRWSQYQKKKVSKTSIFELPRVKNCIGRLCTNPLGDLPPPRGPNIQIG